MITFQLILKDFNHHSHICTLSLKWYHYNTSCPTESFIRKRNTWTSIRVFCSLQWVGTRITQTNLELFKQTITFAISYRLHESSETIFTLCCKTSKTWKKLQNLVTAFLMILG